MRIEEIRAQIQEGKNIERQSGLLHRVIVSLARLNGVKVSGSEATETVTFVTRYIELAPTLMMLIEEGAMAMGTLDRVQPILDAIEDYFLMEEDIIPDHYGLVGLLDDAYLTHTLLQAISDRYELQTGKPLLPTEAQEINMFMRRLIGEPFVSLLDDHVSKTLDDLSGQHDIDQMLLVLAATEFTTVPDPVWEYPQAYRVTGVDLDRAM